MTDSKLQIYQSSTYTESKFPGGFKIIVIDKDNSSCFYYSLGHLAEKFGYFEGIRDKKLSEITFQGNPLLYEHMLDCVHFEWDFKSLDPTILISLHELLKQLKYNHLQEVEEYMTGELEYVKYFMKSDVKQATKTMKTIPFNKKYLDSFKDIDLLREYYNIHVGKFATEVINCLTILRELEIYDRDCNYDNVDIGSLINKCLNNAGNFTKI